MSRYSHIHGAPTRDHPSSADRCHKGQQWPTPKVMPGSRRSPTKSAIEITGMNKWYGEFHVLRDINLTVYRGERIVICGPSGSGKSTLIRCINRLEEHQSGQIIVDGIELTDDLKKHRRNPARSRHGVPAFQSVPASDRARELLAGADLGAQDAEVRGRAAGDEIPPARQDSRSRRRNIPASCRAASSSAWRSRARCA